MPLPLTSRSKEYLRLAVHNDTLFLSKQDIVDYSILLGMNEKTKTVVLGIIDYLHQYTWDKQIETGVKSLGKIAGQGTPTVGVVSPSLLMFCSGCFSKLI
jgi:1-phosphatidylinositol-3-phosphate 5-kinase